MIRFTEKGQEGRHERLESMRKRQRDIKALNVEKECSGWKKFKSVLEGFIEAEENSIKRAVVACAMGGYWDPSTNSIRHETCEKLVSDIRTAYELKERTRLEIDLIEKTDEQVEHITTEIKRIEGIYKEAKEQIA